MKRVSARSVLGTHSNAHSVNVSASLQRVIIGFETFAGTSGSTVGGTGRGLMGERDERMEGMCGGRAEKGCIGLTGVMRSGGWMGLCLCNKNSTGLVVFDAPMGLIGTRRTRWGFVCCG